MLIATLFSLLVSVVVVRIWMQRRSAAEHERAIECHLECVAEFRRLIQKEKAARKARVRKQALRPSPARPANLRWSGIA
jgi:cell division protein FtsL